MPSIQELLYAGIRAVFWLLYLPTITFFTMQFGVAGVGFAIRRLSSTDENDKD